MKSGMCDNGRPASLTVSLRHAGIWLRNIRGIGRGEPQIFDIRGLTPIIFGPTPIISARPSALCSF